MQEFAALLGLSSDRAWHNKEALGSAACSADPLRQLPATKRLTAQLAAASCSLASHASGLEECMGEAERDEGWASAPALLLSAVETILREIGEEPEREV